MAAVAGPRDGLAGGDLIADMDQHAAGVHVSVDGAQGLTVDDVGQHHPPAEPLHAAVLGGGHGAVGERVDRAALG